MAKYDYNKNTFAYPELRDETGRPLKEILDELYLKYGKVSNHSDESKVIWVKRIQEYCKEYKKWPKQSTDSKYMLKDGTTSKQLAKWLEHSGYNSNEFKYAGIKDETGKDIKEILDELYLKYGNIEIIEKVRKIQEYCKEYKEWPKKSREAQKNILKDGTTSKQLYCWLSDSGYTTNRFKYSGIKDETGKDIKETLDELYLKYGRINKKSDESKIIMVRKIQEYCKEYKEWPKKSKESHKNILKDGTTPVQLVQWLIYSGYTKGEFKYSEIKDETGRPIKEILDELYEKYVLNKEKIKTEKKELIALKESLLEQQNETIKNKKL